MKVTHAVLCTAMLSVLGACRAPIGARTDAAHPAVRHPDVDTLLGSLDTRADPCSDFFGYACGHAGRGAAEDDLNVVYQMFHAFDAALWPWLIDTDAGDDPSTTQIRRFIAACRQAAEVENIGSVLATLLRDIDAVHDREGFLHVAGLLARAGIDTLFVHDVEVSNEAFAPVLTLRGAASTDSVAGAPNVDRIMARLDPAEATMSMELGARVAALEGALGAAQRDNLELSSPRAFASNVAGGGWATFVDALALPEETTLSFRSRTHAEAVLTLIDRTSPEVLRAYLRWQLLEHVASELPKSWTLADDRPPNQGAYCEELALELFDWHLMRAFGSQWAGARARGGARQLALDVRDVIVREIEDAGWLEPEARVAMKTVIETTRLRVGWVDAPWGTLPEMSDGDHVANVLALRGFQFQRSASATFGYEEGLTAGPLLMTQCWNDQWLHGVDVALGMLQRPVFHPDRPRWMNIAALGMILGHEFHHALDAGDLDLHLERHDYDPALAGELAASHACLTDAYQKNRPALTNALRAVYEGKDEWLEETFADIGGLRHAYRLFAGERDARRVDDVPGLRPDALYFIAYAQYFCGWSDGPMDELGRARVNAAVAPLPEFRKAFACSTESPQVLEHACAMW